MDAELYVDIVNRGYALEDRYRITAEGLSLDTSTLPTVKKVEAAFRVIPDTNPMFDH